MTTKTTGATIRARVPAELRRDLETEARLRGCSLSDVVRERLLASGRGGQSRRARR